MNGVKFSIDTLLAHNNQKMCYNLSVIKITKQYYGK